MHPDPRRVLPVIMLLALLGGLWWWFGPRASAETGELIASGTIEVAQISVASELAGRVVSVEFAEGERLRAGQALILLDDALLRAQRGQAEASAEAADRAAAAAEANLAMLAAGPTREQLRAAESAVERAQAVTDAAQAAYDALPSQAPSSPQAESLNQQLEVALATLDSTQAQLDLLKAGARPEQLDAARAQAEAARAQARAAEAAMAVLDVQLGKLTITAPSDGTVLSKAVEMGAVVLPGGTLAVMGNLDHLEITVFVPEDRYGTIRIGQAADVAVDSYPGETFSATVVQIADQAEFTPRNVQTGEGRKMTVYAVRLSIDDPEGKLKPGMPADLKFRD